MNIPSATLDPLRTYEVPKPAEPLTGLMSEMELSSQTTRIRIWYYRTWHPLEAVLARGYFDSMKDVRLRKEDRIEIIANFSTSTSTSTGTGTTPSQHALLVVDSVSKEGRVTASLLQAYQRQIS